MRVIITGGTGLIGQAFAALMLEDGHETILLSRTPDAHRDRVPRGAVVRGWDATSGAGWHRLLNDETAIVNLAGENPAARVRWTKAHKRRLYDSRIHAAEAVLDAVRLENCPPKALLQASAVGYYGNRGDARLTESSFAGDGFLADMCKVWERTVRDLPTRQVILRIGIVLSLQSGALPPFKTAAGLFSARLGNGKQWLPWIHLYDTANAMRFLLYREASQGAYNLTAPEPVTNAAFMATAARVMGRLPLFPIPRAALMALLGEMAATVLDGQRVIPQRLMDEGFTFRYPTLEPALRDLLRG